MAENGVPEGAQGLTAPRRGGQRGRGSHCSEGWEERAMQVWTGAGGLEAGQVWGADSGGPGQFVSRTRREQPWWEVPC